MAATEVKGTYRANCQSLNRPIAAAFMILFTATSLNDTGNGRLVVKLTPARMVTDCPHMSAGIFKVEATNVNVAEDDSPNVASIGTFQHMLARSHNRSAIASLIGMLVTTMATPP